MLPIYANSLQLENRTIFLASEPVDFRMSIDGLSRFIQNKNNTQLYDGSIYVFYNRHQDKIKCLYWDLNGFVLYYKRLDKCKFRFRKMLNSMESISATELDIILSGFDPNDVQRIPATLEHQP